jgi:hypothetical protein
MRLNQQVMLAAAIWMVAAGCSGADDSVSVETVATSVRQEKAKQVDGLRFRVWNITNFAAAPSDDYVLDPTLRGERVRIAVTQSKGKIDMLSAATRVLYQTGLVPLSYRGEELTPFRKVLREVTPVEFFAPTFAQPDAAIGAYGESGASCLLIIMADGDGREYKITTHAGKRYATFEYAVAPSKKR